MVLRNRTIVVTGGAGFIGSNLAHTLAADNDVRVIDDLSTGKRENIQPLIDDGAIEFVHGSILNLPLLQETLREADIVFHEAAIPSVPRSIKDPVLSNQANVCGTLNVLLAARDNRVRKVVYASSSSVYGDTPTLPKQEDMKPMPLSPYAVSKLTGEYYGQVFTTVFDVPTVSLRYFNVFGPHQDPKSEYAAVIPNFLAKIRAGQSPMVYGDGEQTRDFTFVGDVVAANILAATSTATGVFNVAGGRRISVNDLAALLLRLLGSSLDVVHAPPRSGDVRHSLADISKANNQFGYKPKASMEKGIQETIEWFQRQS